MKNKNIFIPASANSTCNLAFEVWWAELLANKTFPLKRVMRYLSDKMMEGEGNYDMNLVSPAQIKEMMRSTWFKASNYGQKAATGVSNST